MVLVLFVPYFVRVNAMFFWGKFYIFFLGFRSFLKYLDHEIQFLFGHRNWGEVVCGWMMFIFV